MGTLDQTPVVNKDLSFKQKDVSNSDTFPVTLWNPSGDKRVMVHNLIIFLNNKNANSTLTLKIEVDRKGTWYEVCSAGKRNQGYDHMVVDLKGLVKAKELRIRKVGTSTNFNGYATATGEVID